MQIDKRLLTINKYSRPGTKVGKIKNIVVHWVGNANSKAINNRNYFESLKECKKDKNGNLIYASSHYIVGLDGEVIMCVPEEEISYHGNCANSYSIGIENCHPDWQGKFNNQTYQSLVELCADLCKRHNLDPIKDIIRHYDITKKDCPSYYVKNPKMWDQFKNDVKAFMNPLDEAYKAAVTKLAYEFDINDSSWYPNPNTKNLPALMQKIGRKWYGTNDYNFIVHRMFQDKIISNTELWLSHEYNENHIKSLIKKIATRL